MRRIRWLPSARDDLFDIMDYIAEDSPRASASMGERLVASVLPTTEHPYMFRAGRVEGTREIVAHPNYIVVYRVVDDLIEVIRVLHAAQDYP